MTSKETISQIFDRFAQTRVLVIGDVMLDTYLWGISERMSPEAPVPIVDVNELQHRLGGAANVALNLKALGAKVALCSVIGEDNEARVLQQLLAQNHIDGKNLVLSNDRMTTVKTRVMDGQRQLLRYDREEKDDIGEKDEKKLLALVTDIIEEQKADVVIFQDYNKGVLTKKVIETVTSLCNKAAIPIAVDPKKKHFFAYSGASLFKPNLKEVKEALGMEIDKHDLNQLQEAAALLKKEIGRQITLITLSEGGVFVSDNGEGKIYPALPRSIVDVSGAGDTVISVAALALAQRLDMGLLAQLANIAGGLVCEQPGVAPVDKAVFFAESIQFLVNSPQSTVH